MGDIKLVWQEKYRPKTIDDYQFPNQQIRNSVLKILEDRAPHHLLLSGPPGCGKTTLAKLLVNELKIPDMDIMFVNASDESRIEVFRDRIKGFAQTFAHEDIKLVILDEADYLSHHFQAALRSLMETEADTCRFILTCNNPNRISEAVKSRCQVWKFPKPEFNNVVELCANILVKEGIRIPDLETLDTIVQLAYPDTRKAINLIEQYSINGVLQAPGDEATGAAQWEADLIAHVKNSDFSEAFNVVKTNASFDDYDTVYKILYMNVKNAQAVVYIADYLYKNAIVSDPEINLAACCYKLQDVVK